MPGVVERLQSTATQRHVENVTQADAQTVPSNVTVLYQWLIAKNHAPMTGPRAGRCPGCGGGASAGGGPYSGWNRYATCFTRSTLMVLGPGIVLTGGATRYLSGEIPCTPRTLVSRSAGIL